MKKALKSKKIPDLKTYKLSLLKRICGFPEVLLRRLCFLAYVVLRSTEITLKEAGVNISSQELIETLKDVETNIIRNRVKVPSKAYGLPRKLSAKAKKIYKLFGKEFPERAYEIT